VRIPIGHRGVSHIEVNDLAYHRNGIGGEGFYAIRFHAHNDDSTAQEMVATVFPEPGYVAVLDVELLYGGRGTVGTVAFGANSWRGDVYEGALRKAITAREIKDYGTSDFNAKGER
jgi:hypothetical protein